MTLDTNFRLLSNPESAFQLCQALATKILTPEALTGEEALSLDGQPRSGRGIASLLRQWRQPPPKKARVQPNEEAPLNSVAGSYNVYCKLNLFIFYTDFRKDHLVTVTVTVI
jgi:hypothetical protein